MSSSDSPDADLMARLISGDQAALGELYDRHAPNAYRIAYRLTSDHGLAEEVVQETMLTLWDRAEQYDASVATLGTWLATIARNRTIDRLRVRGRRVAALPLSSIAVRDSEDPDAADRALERGVVLAAGVRELDPAAAGETAWLRETLASVVASLPPPERRVIELAYSGDLTQSEIAARLGWPLGTVKTRTRRALASLRMALGEAMGPDTESIQGLAAVIQPTPPPRATGRTRRRESIGPPCVSC